jgi:O-antigen/teichoic acid export membrane protein
MKIDFNLFLGISLRFSGILSRYFFIMIFGNYFSPELFSEFNLFSSLIVYLIFFSGLDYYNHLHKKYYQDRNSFYNYLNNYFFLSIFSVLVGVLISFPFYNDFGDSSVLPILLLIICFSELFLHES